MGGAQGAQGGYGASDAAAPQQSYGSAPQQSYGEQSYGHEDYHQAVAVNYHRPKVCVGLCPEEAPFWSAASASCAVGIRRQEIPYQAESYGAQQSYGEQQSYGGGAVQQSAPQSGYRSLQTSEVSAPRDSIDTRNNRVSNGGRIALWVGFVILFFSSVYFVNRYLWYYYLADISDGVKDWRIGSNSGSEIFTFLASLAYLSMASHHGFYVRCFDGREFYYARYLDWIITTPMMLHALAYFGDMTDNIWHYLFFNDILMIASGLIGSTVGGGERWAFFGFSMLCFLPVIYYLCNVKNFVIDNRLFDGAGAVANAEIALAQAVNGNLGAAFRPSLFFMGTYDSIMRLTVLAWSMYPIVWILAEGTGTLSANAEAVIYTILDVISKSGFGILIVTAKKNTFQQLVAAGFQFVDPNLDFTAAQLAAAMTVNTITNSGSSIL